jgi:YidC/Oxa1 family membrane protein insertase
MENSRHTAREFAEMERLLAPENEKLRTLIFYAERFADHRYYRDFIDQILEQSELRICYLTSDPEDPIFKTENKRVAPFFIRNLLATVMQKLDSKAIVMTTPDLNMGMVKRAPNSHHIYAYHGVSSIHQGYRLHGLDHFDSLLCIAQYQIDELRKMEELYNLPARELPLVGYPYIERIYTDHQRYLSTQPGQSAGSRKKCLLAPTWDPKGKSSIMDSCIEPLIEQLASIDMDFTVRPHPEYVKRFAKRIDAIKKLAKKATNITFETAPSDPKLSLHQADILITDHSTISFDFFLGTERAVVFIDTPRRIDNEEMNRIGTEPVEETVRSSLGARVAPTNLGSLKEILPTLLAKSSQPSFRQSVVELRHQLVSNWQHSAEIGAAHIVKHCR